MNSRGWNTASPASCYWNFSEQAADGPVNGRVGERAQRRGIGGGGGELSATGTDCWNALIQVPWKLCLWFPPVMVSGMSTRSNPAVSRIPRRTFLAGLGGCAGAVAGCSTLQPSPAPVLRVLSYNTHHCEGLDGKIDVARIARVIMTSGADIVALQELDQRAERTGKVDQAQEIAALTGMQMRYGAAMEFQGGHYGQAILSRWPIWRFNVHFLPNPSNREPRIAVSSMIQTAMGYTVRFVGLHLDAAAEDETRWLQVNALREAFGEEKALPTILAGDFNDVPGSRSMDRLFKDWADTSFGNPSPTSPANAPAQRIDYVLLRPKIWGVVRSDGLDESVASDHRPLLVTLQMPPR